MYRNVTENRSVDSSEFVLEILLSERQIRFVSIVDGNAKAVIKIKTDGGEKRRTTNIAKR